jgi:uncharacterized protein (DUF983 family)
MLMDEYKNDTVIKEDILDKCPYCTATTWKVYVHGHAQCSKCGKNIDECCQGELFSG